MSELGAAPQRAWEVAVLEQLDAPIPSEVQRAGESVVTDVLAATVAGASVPALQEFRETADLPAGDIRILGTETETSLPFAAMLNTAAAIAVEIEEGHNRGGHVGASLIAGSIGAAQAHALDGASYINHCIRVYEVCVRLEEAIFAMKDRLNAAVPWVLRDPHATWTVVGPALATALCMGAGDAQLRETFRIGANLAVISMYDPYAEGAPARNLTAGMSAQAGVSAAIAASGGIQGSPAAMRAVYDPLEELVEGFDEKFAELGEHWEVTEAYHKPIPSCRYTHPPLDALIDAVGADAVDADAVEAILVSTFTNAAEMDHTDPQTMTGGKFSTPYVLSRYLTDGAVTHADFEPARVTEAGLRPLMQRVQLQADPVFDDRFPDEWGAQVHVRLTDGTQLEGSCRYPRGDHRNPLPDTERRQRDAELLALALSDAGSALAALDAIATTPITQTVEALCRR